MIYFKKETSSVTAPDYSIKITKDGYTFVVNSVDGTVSAPIYNGELLIQKKLQVSFEDDSWEEIKANLEYDRNSYPIGAEKIVNMNLEGTPKDYKLRLVNTESCGAYIETSCGVVIEFVTTIGTHVMNSSGRIGWDSSEMKRYLNTEKDSSSNPTSIYSKLPSDLKNVIILTRSALYQDYLYLLGLKEVGMDVFSSQEWWDKIKDYGNQTLKYYSDNNNNAARIKYDTATGSGSSGQMYWTRTSINYYGSYHFSITEDGGSSSNRSADNSFSIAPAFRILD